jgi:Arc/MetJ-type ribon-helix-helix transcriptional regulator
MIDDPTVTVPPEIYEQCEQQIKGTTFESVDEYVEFVLSEVLDPTKAVADADTTGSHGATEEQLEALGYLDR